MQIIKNFRQNRHKASTEAGFTIVEFLIATAVFSLVILLCSMAIIHVGRMYYKGMVTNRTQEASRVVVEDLVASVQFGPSAPDPNTFRRLAGPTTYNGVEVYALCLGSVRYTYAPAAALGGTSGVQGSITWSRHVLWRDVRVDDSCTTLDITQENPGGINGREMLSENMRLPVLDVPAPSPGEPWAIRAVVSYGDDPVLFEDGSNFGICKGVIAGGQFCAVSGFNTSVTKRL